MPLRRSLAALGLLASLWLPAAVRAGLGAEPAKLRALAERGGPRREVLDLALDALQCAPVSWSKPLLTVIDYSLPSTEPRLWVIDLRAARVLYRELVAHGRNTGENEARAFSNDPGSKQSSLGLFRTLDTYQGRHGLSLRLEGLEPGVNDRAEERAIVIHGAPYVSRDFAEEHGRLGRSWGCPALDDDVSADVIDAIKQGSAVFSYYPDPQWEQGSSFLGCR